MRRSLCLLLLGAGLAAFTASPSAFARGGGGGGGGGGHFTIAIHSAPAGRSARGFNHAAPGFNHSPFPHRAFRAADRRRRNGWYNGFGGCCYALPYGYGYGYGDAAGPGATPDYYQPTGYPPPPRPLPPMGMTIEHSHGVTIYRGPPVLP